ncbi:leucyl aminopeptidase [Mycena amicta]|nr:leucyl aminopeptidase [Mycena amicta]
MAADLYRLPTVITPIHYDLVVRTDLQTQTFDGVVAIALDVHERTSTIVLNACDIQLGDASLVVVDQTVALISQKLHPDTERLVLELSAPLGAGTSATVRLPFRGALRSINGFFKSEWEHDGVKECYAATYFEPTYARRAFPCFDEPILKATFAVTLVSRVGTVNLSNMPAVSEHPFDFNSDAAAIGLSDSFTPATSDAGNWIVTRFATTPKMSTYIVAFACGPFAYSELEYTSSLSGRTVPVRLYATPDIVKHGEFAVEIAAKVLPMLEEMFDLEYPLPKMDFVCAVGSLGALENWGLIVGEPGAFIFDPATGATVTKKRIVATVSHELAHQWFGNIVTMSWWDNLWLNEGFATLLGGVISGLYPEWNTSAAAVNNILQRALNVDAKLNSHSVQMECPDANNVDETLDTISYMKGCSVLRMLLDLLGEETFFKGVTLYLKNHLYGNSVTEDLWAALGTASGTDVLQLMNNWILATGYPVVTVSEAPGGITVRQNRFLATGPAEQKDDETLWTIPLNIATVDAAGTVAVNKTILLSTRELFVPLDTSRPFKLNAGSSGFYRVLYSSDRLNKLALASAKYDLRDRIGMMNDAMALAKAGFAPVSSALTLIEGLAGDSEYLVLEGIAANITSVLDSWWEHEYIVEQLNKLNASLFKPLVDKLGYEYPAGEPTDTVVTRSLAVRSAGYAGEASVVAELLRRFKMFAASNDKSSIPPDLQMTIYRVAVQHGGRDCYEKMWEILRTTKSPEEEMYAALAIGGATDPTLIADTLSRILGESDSNVDWMMHSLSANPKSRHAMAQFFKDNYDALYTRFETSGFHHYSQQPFRLLSSQADYDATEAFFKTKDTSKYTRPLQQTFEIIRGNIEYLERSTAEVVEWFKQRELEVKQQP